MLRERREVPPRGLQQDYSHVDVITFGVKWVTPIPRHGVKGPFLVNDAKTLEAHGLTMRFLKQNISVPVPEVVRNDMTFDNEFGAPGWTEYLSGMSGLAQHLIPGRSLKR